MVSPHAAWSNGGGSGKDGAAPGLPKLSSSSQLGAVWNPAFAAGGLRRFAPNVPRSGLSQISGLGPSGIPGVRVLAPMDPNPFAESALSAPGAELVIELPGLRDASAGFATRPFGEKFARGGVVPPMGSGKPSARRGSGRVKVA